jgi:tetratricopeptide (TPR) repeat protein
MRDESRVDDPDRGVEMNASILTAPTALRTAVSFGSATAKESAAAMIGEAEAALEVNDLAAALAVLEDVYDFTRTSPILTNRALLAESWARMATGDLDGAEELLARASDITAKPEFTERDRAEVLYRLGCCRLQRSKTGNATQLFTVALEVCHRSGEECTKLRAHILQWRARCWLRQHLPDMAREDVELAIELAEALDEPRTLAHACFQASVVSERQSQWLLARMYGERALDGYERLGDRVNCHKVLNNLGGINVLLGSAERATDCLLRAVAIAQELGDDIGAAYALSTLAHMTLKFDDPCGADGYARQARELLEGREAHLGELGNVLLLIGRAMLEQNELSEAESFFRRADAAFEQISSVGHRAEAWVAQGDLARRRGDTDAAADRYRKAAIALQDVHL